MTRNHDPFTQALLSLRERTTRGVYGPGQPIVIVEEAKRLSLSVTPVREALSWLSGEGLVERAASGGYFAPRLNAAIVRDRFGFQWICLTSALSMAPVAPAVRAIGRHVRAQATFDQIIRRTGSPALLDAYRRVASQLRAISTAEAALLSDIADEAYDIHRQHAEPQGSGLAEALARYHQRRIDLAADLVIVMRDGPPVQADEFGS